MSEPEGIPIGDNEVITCISVRGREQDAALIDDLIPGAKWLWHALEVRCVAGCCNTAAFDFTPERIQWVAGGDVEPLRQPSSRSTQWGDAAELATQLEEAINEIRNLDAGVVYSEVFNAFFDKNDFIELLVHVSSELRRV